MLQSQGRHRCKGGTPGQEEQASAHAAATATEVQPAGNDENRAGQQPGDAGRQRWAAAFRQGGGKKRVRWAVPDSESEGDAPSEEEEGWGQGRRTQGPAPEQGGGGSSASKAGMGTHASSRAARRSISEEAEAEEGSGEELQSPLRRRPAAAAPHQTPRGVAAARLLADWTIRQGAGGHPDAAPGVAVPVHAAALAPPPPAAAAAAAFPGTAVRVHAAPDPRLGPQRPTSLYQALSRQQQAAAAAAAGSAAAAQQRQQDAAAAATAAVAGGRSSPHKWWQVAVQPGRAGTGSGAHPAASAPHAAPRPAGAVSTPATMAAAPALPAAPPLVAQPPAYVATALLGELLCLLRSVVSNDDAEAFVGAVVQHQSAANMAAAAAAAAAVLSAGGSAAAAQEASTSTLLTALAGDLGRRIQASRQLMQQQGGAAVLAEGVRGALRAATLSTAIGGLANMLAGRAQ